MIALLMLATAFPVGDRIDVIQGWRVHRSADGTCGIEGEVNGREFFAATLLKFPGQYLVGVGARTWQSIVPTRRYPVTVSIKGQVIVAEGWGAQGYMGYKFVAALIPKPAFDDAVVKQRVVTFSLDNQEIGQVMFNLLAVGAVNRCGSAAADPFTK